MVSQFARHWVYSFPVITVDLPAILARIIVIKVNIIAVLTWDNNSKIEAQEI